MLLSVETFEGVALVGPSFDGIATLTKHLVEEDS